MRVVTDPPVGKSPAIFGRLPDGAPGNVRASPGMTLAKGDVAVYDMAVDAAETYELAKAGAGLAVPVGITSSANPVPDGAVALGPAASGHEPAAAGPAADSHGRPPSREGRRHAEMGGLRAAGWHGWDRP